MKNLRGPKMSVIMLFWIISITSCASSLKQVPNLDSRKLRIDVEYDGGFEYQSEVCTGHLWWRDCKTVSEKTNFCGSKEVRKDLKARGFKLGVYR